MFENNNSLSFIVDIQVALENPEPELPGTNTIEQWVSKTLTNFKNNAEVSLRIVEANEIQALNKRYRQKDKTTNVLAFPSELPEGIELDYELLGDVVICSDVVKQEAIQQQKTYQAHFAHMLIHGILHLLGYDHQNDQDARKMEEQEINILKELDFANPYPHIY